MNFRPVGRSLSRTAVALSLTGAVALTVAARPHPNLTDAPQPASPLPATPPTGAQGDSLQTIGAMLEAAATAPAPDAVASTPRVPALTRSASGWPVDPQTGQTLINGQPVVGRVFVMKKTDGIEAYRYDAVYANEPGQPERPTVGTSYVTPPLSASRRIRGVMVQSTLWSMDQKRSARMHHHYR